MRDSGIDGLKGLAIIAVVFIHGRFVFPAYIYESAGYSIFDWCVPLFVILSAYGLSGSCDRAKAGSGWRWISEKTKRSMLPFVVWSLVYFLWNWISHGHVELIGLYRAFNGFAWPGQYYFILLLQVIWLVAALRGVTIAAGKIAAVVAVGALVYIFWPVSADQRELYLGLSFRLIVFWLPYVAVGVFASYRPLNGLSAPLSVAALVVAGSLLLMILESLVRRELGLVGLGGYFRVSTLFAAISLFAFGYRLLSSKSLRLVTAALGTLGRHSLGIFCLNPLMLAFLLRFYAWQFESSAYAAGSNAFAVLAGIGLIASAILGCLLVSIGLRRIGAGRLVC